MSDFVCPDAASHGSPFRYCAIKGCGWMEPVPASPDNELRNAIKHLLNFHSRENVSNTPDHILADVMMTALVSFEALMTSPDLAGSAHPPTEPASTKPKSTREHLASIREKHPDPSNPVAHTLSVYADQPDWAFVIVATVNIYGDRVRTGLTWGDLRNLAARTCSPTREECTDDSPCASCPHLEAS